MAINWCIPKQLGTKEVIFNYCEQLINSIIKKSECNDIDLICENVKSNIKACPFETVLYIGEFCERELLKLNSKLEEF
jgi:hypothetical protein